MLTLPVSRLARTISLALSAGFLWCALVGLSEPRLSAAVGTAGVAQLAGHGPDVVLQHVLRADDGEDASGTQRSWRRSSTRRTLRSIAARVLVSALPGNPLPSVSYPGGGVCVRNRLARRGAVALRLLSAPTRAPPSLA